VQAALWALIQSYEARLVALQRQLDDLQQRLGQNSTNSSKPPSSDAPALKRSPPQPASGKPRGGQPGHARLQRALLPPDVVYELKPAACRRCQAPLHGDDPAPLPHQVVELPLIRPHVTEYRRHRLCCPACHTQTCAPLPAAAAGTCVGPRLQSALAYLSGACRLSKRLVQDVADGLFGVQLSVGAICAQEQQTAQALDPSVAEA